MAINQFALFIDKGAQFSSCRQYRYALWRVWDHSIPSIVFIGLNPSTANEQEDDPTIRRVIGFAKRWGYGGVIMCNLFGIISSDPSVLTTCEDPIGENDAYLDFYTPPHRDLVFAWGNFPEARDRAKEVVKRLGRGYCLGKNQNGTPKHPLYLKNDTKLIPYN